MSAKKTKTTGAKKTLVAKAKPKLAVFEGDAPAKGKGRKQRMAGDESAKKLARLEALDAPAAVAESPTAADASTAEGDAAEAAIPTKKPKAAKPKRMSALDAAAKVLQESGEPMNAQALIAAMAAKGYWTSPGGKTPHATLYAAITREIAVKGTESRFAKASKGHFAATPAG
jgi:hypothetical protein